VSGCVEKRWAGGFVIELTARLLVKVQADALA
jgi:hypothetical protein